jgi:Cu(I)/Ag(I) efflux system membrane fusion protein
MFALRGNVRALALGIVKFILVSAVALGILILFGWWLAPEEITRNEAPASMGAESAGVIYTCSMHPHIRLPKPGNCPICGMKLVPAADGTTGKSGVTLDAHGRAMARVETVEIGRGPVELAIETVGRFELDESRVSRIVAWADARIEQVHVPSSWVAVRKGDPLVDLYVPSLPLLASELRSARGLQPGAAEAIVERMKRIGLDDGQISKMEQAEHPEPRFTYHSPRAGIVESRMAEPGMAVKEGDPLFRIVQFDALALDIEIYEKDVPFVGPGTPFQYSLPALPGDVHTGNVEYLKGSVNAESRTVPARAIVENPGGAARPGMWARVRLSIPLGSDGLPVTPRAPEFTATRPAAAGRIVYVCPMHCVPPAAAAGICSVCGMQLVAEDAAATLPIRVPKSAVLDTGKRKIVYIDKSDHYELRKIETGVLAGDHYVVLSGLKPGDLVVTRGAFLVDSQAQVSGLPSLIFIEGATR